MDSQFVANILIFQVILQELQYLTLDNGVVQWLDFRSIVGSDWINLIPWMCKGDKSIVFTLQGRVCDTTWVRIRQGTKKIFLCAD